VHNGLRLKRHASPSFSSITLKLDAFNFNLVVDPCEKISLLTHVQEFGSQSVFHHTKFSLECHFLFFFYQSFQFFQLFL
jgi:hypothetical protein